MTYIGAGSASVLAEALLHAVAARQPVAAEVLQASYIQCVFVCVGTE